MTMSISLEVSGEGDWKEMICLSVYIIAWSMAKLRTRRSLGLKL